METKEAGNVNDQLMNCISTAVNFHRTIEAQNHCWKRPPRSFTPNIHLSPIFPTKL